MAYIIKNGIKCHWGFKLLPKGYTAIMLFGHIFFRDDEKSVRAYLASPFADQTINHERIHMIQAASFKTGYFGFYMAYLWYWFIGLFKYGFERYASYDNIPFEREAYGNEVDTNYNKSNWKKYK